VEVSSDDCDAHCSWIPFTTTPNPHSLSIMSKKKAKPTVDSVTDDRPSVELTDRDVILGEGSAGHKTNLLLQDMMRLHRILHKLQQHHVPETVEEVAHIADSLYRLVTAGKTYELAGLKDVPKPFMKSHGRFLENQGVCWKELDEVKVKEALAKAMLAEFKLDDLGDLDSVPYKDLKTQLARSAAKSDASSAEATIFPQSRDAILLPVSSDISHEKMYEQQIGNKTIFHLASMLVTSQTNCSEKRVEAGIAMLKGLEESEYHDEAQEMLPSATKTARFLIRSPIEQDGTVAWSLMDAAQAVEFAVIFSFEVFLEKEIHIMATGGNVGDIGAGIASLPMSDITKPGTEPVLGEPTDQDVLFGRGGMTNSHVGNRRFRDIIALHRYVNELDS
jgi:hypothetical protein